MRNLKFVVVLFATTTLGACGGLGFNTAPGGTSVKSRKPSAVLEVPPDLVSTTSEQITAARIEQEELDKRQVLPEPYLTELIQDGDQQWLEIEASPQNVWRRVLAYWESLGVGLVLNQPQTGTMETSWMSPERRPGVLASVFAGLNDAGYDKYRVRLERAGENRTRLYVEHTWSQKILVTYAIKESESVWVETEDPEKELELLKAVAFEMDPSNILGG